MTTLGNFKYHNDKVTLKRNDDKPECKVMIAIRGRKKVVHTFDNLSQARTVFEDAVQESISYTSLSTVDSY
jgi:hypothetical protein